jgi:excisionase family DNA binding protein
MEVRDLRVNKPVNKLLTLSEVAGYLQIAEKTLLKMIHRKEIPSIKIGNQWRFLKQAIDKWLISKMQPAAYTGNNISFDSTIHYVPIDRLLKKDTIIMDLEPGTKEEILTILIQPLIDKELIKDNQYYLSKLLDRENIMSTGLSKGVAIPHIRKIEENPPCTNIIVAGICKKGTNFDSFDGKKTFLFFLVCSDNEILHIRIIARLSRIFRDTETISAFITSKSKDEFMHLFIKHNQRLNFPA